MDVKVIIRAVNREGQEASFSSPLEAPASIQVREQLKQPTTFTITYPDDICDGDFRMVEEKTFDPFSEIEVCVQLDNDIYCLVRGLVQSQQIKFMHGGEGSQLQISGADNTIRMGWVTETRNWKKKIGHLEILDMLTTAQKTKKDKPVPQFSFDGYSIMGKVYDGSKNEIKTGTPGDDDSTGDSGDNADSFKAQMQRQDDLAFLRKLGEQRGYHLWISYEGEHKEIIHFEKLPEWQYKENEPVAPAITLWFNQAGHTDLDEFSVSWDADRPTSVESIQTDQRTKNDSVNEIEEAPQLKLGNKTLSSMTGNLLKAFQSAVPIDPEDQQERNAAALNESEWFIKASCSTSYDRLCKNKDIQEGTYGRIFHAHTLINIVGAGTKHSGTYLVSGVTHNISAGSYKVQLELTRNAWVELDTTEIKKSIPDQEAVTQ